jgi:hypothetical protein
LKVVPASATILGSSSTLFSIALEGHTSMRDHDLPCLVAAATIEREWLVDLLSIDGCLTLGLLEW